MRVVVGVAVVDGGRRVMVERNHCGVLMAPNQTSAFANIQNWVMSF